MRALSSGLSPEARVMKKTTKIFLETNWGAKSLVALYISVISGVVLSLQYDFSEPYYSIGSLELIVPYGYFWRSLHFFSSQAFFILLIFHLLAVVMKLYFAERKVVGDNKETVINMGERWLKPVLSVPVAILLLFTGYVLKADSTGKSAGLIAENIILSAPLVGEVINNFLFNISLTGLKVVYANHLIGFCVLWLFLVWDHLKKYRVSLMDHGKTVTGIIITSLLFTAPLDPFVPGEFHISGPWFFVGLQEMLRLIQPFWAGILFPALAIVLLYLLMNTSQHAKLVMACSTLWIMVYSCFTIIGLAR